jgi:SAM-dependent methyltransferase
VTAVPPPSPRRRPAPSSPPSPGRPHAPPSPRRPLAPSSPPSPRSVVAAGYDALGPRYHSWSAGSPVRLTYVSRVLDRLRPGSVVVDLGCGPGDPATRLLAADHHVLGVDVSLVQLRLAAAAAPSALLVRADITEFSLRPGSVDAVVSFYALGHLPPSAHASLFAAVSTWLRPGGLLLTSTPVLPGSSIDDNWLGVPMYFGGIGPEPTRAAVVSAGLTFESSELALEDEGTGQAAHFHWITATKPATTPPGREKGGG